MGADNLACCFPILVRIRYVLNLDRIEEWSREDCDFARRCDKFHQGIPVSIVGNCGEDNRGYDMRLKLDIKSISDEGSFEFMVPLFRILDNSKDLIFTNSELKSLPFGT